MAKKTTKEEGKKMPAVAEEPGLMLVRLELTPDIHKEFRVEAAKEGVSMAKMARRLIEEWVASRKVGTK
jgi:predicted HicB family RNase H-like nuclease